jgi:hypothetical protein
MAAAASLLLDRAGLVRHFCDTTLGETMKHLAVLALALTICSTSSAKAGALSDPILEQDLIVEEAKAGSSSSGVTLVALMGLLLFSAALSK